jgi:hypothetical protein
VIAIIAKRSATFYLAANKQIMSARTTSALAIFVLFFGVTLLDTFKRSDTLMIGFWILMALVFFVLTRANAKDRQS